MGPCPGRDHRFPRYQLLILVSSRYGVYGAPSWLVTLLVATENPCMPAHVVVLGRQSQALVPVPSKAVVDGGKVDDMS
jgi:hypothetical protein